MLFLEKLKSKFSTSFHALKHKNFRIFWSCQIISMIGSWMQSISLPWISYDITKSPFLLGVVGALQFAPTLFFALFVGVLIDRIEKKKLIIITQSILSVLALILAVLVFAKKIEYWHILIIAGIQGFTNMFDMPSRQTFVIEMVGKDDLMNAIGLNSMIFNAARIIGPAFAGVIMAGFGVGFCFLLNCISFLPLIVGLFFIQPILVTMRRDPKNIFREIAEGLKYIYSDKILLKTIIAVAVIGTFIMNYSVMIPVFAKTVLLGNEASFGLLMSSMGVGSLIGALTIAARSKRGPKQITLIITSISVSIVFILIGLNNNFLLTSILMALSGFCAVSFLTTANSALQLNSKDEFRSRVVSVYSLVFLGSTPFGNLITGGISANFGISACYIAVGITVLVLVSLVFFIGRKKKIPTQKNVILS